MKSQLQPPPWIDRFLQWRLPEEQFEEVQGDMHELYSQWMKQMSPNKARWLYVVNAVTFLRPLPKRADSPRHIYSQANSFDMIRNYLMIAFRNMRKQKFHSF